MPFWLEEEIMKKVLPIFLFAVAMLGTGFAQAADTPDEQFSMANLDLNTNHSSEYGVYFQDSIKALQTPTVLVAFDPGGSIPKNGAICSSLDERACANQTQMNFKTFLGRCESAGDVNCIESVYALDPKSGMRIDGKLKFLMPSTLLNPFKGDMSRGIPDSGNPSIWTLPGAPNGTGSEDYAVLVEVSGDVIKGQVEPVRSAFTASIFPVTLKSDVRYKRWFSEITDKDFPGNAHPISSNLSQLDPSICVIVDDGLCAIRQSFPDGFEYGLSIRFSRTVNGWLHGRLSNPKIDYELKPYGTRIALQGKSLKVPIVAGYVPAGKITNEVKSKIGGLPRLGDTINPSSYYSENFAVWNELLGDKAVASPGQWIFYNLPEDQLRGADQCITNSKTLAGFVTTNSTTYYAGPPVFNKETQSLDYKVASAHYLKDGSVFQGEYNLYIDSKVARCIYQFSSAPISATISIVDENGEAKVATTTVQESNGWIHLSAAGFTFSSPTLKVKMIQQGSPIPSATAPTKYTAIICVKGKSSKRIAAVKPVCPSGWKKK